MYVYIFKTQSKTNFHFTLNTTNECEVKVIFVKTKNYVMMQIQYKSRETFLMIQNAYSD